MQNKAVFLDRDGVINETIFRMGKPRAPYSLEELKLCHGVKEAVEILKSHGFLLIIVTNQPDVARGWVNREMVEAVNNHIMEVLGLDGLKVCYHTEKDGCQCRKPRPGMILEAQKERNIDASRSFMIGDRHSDIEAGKRAGLRSLLVGPGDDKNGTAPDAQVPSLLEGAKWIIGQT